MPISLQDPLVRSALHDVRIPTTKSVPLPGGSTVTITRPNPSRADWRDHRRPVPRGVVYLAADADSDTGPAVSMK